MELVKTCATLKGGTIRIKFQEIAFPDVDKNKGVTETAPISSIGRHYRPLPALHVRTQYSVPGGACRSVILRARGHYIASLHEVPEVAYSDGLGEGASAGGPGYYEALVPSAQCMMG